MPGETAMPPFHLAFPVTDLEAARAFYAGLLGCPTGREDARWIDFDFFGHQITAHLVDTGTRPPTNPVDGEQVPASHFGAVLSMAEWKSLSKKLEAAEADFLIAPTIRFKGEVGEQATMFVRDPSGNALEFKSFADPSRLFAR